MGSLKSSSDVSSLPDLKSSSDTRAKKHSVGEKIISFMFDGPLGTASSKNARELRKKWEDDKLDIPRTAEEETAPG